MGLLTVKCALNHRGSISLIETHEMVLVIPVILECTCEKQYLCISYVD